MVPKIYHTLQNIMLLEVMYIHVQHKSKVSCMVHIAGIINKVCVCLYHYSNLIP